VPPRLRKPDGGTYRSPWLAFGFFMFIAQLCNVGHALVEVSGRLSELPPWMPTWVIYTFAGALAALFPLGGTMLVHMSGFLRAHGADAAWIDEDALRVGQRAQESTRARTPKPTRAHADDERAPEVTQDAHGERAPEPEPLTLTDAQMALPEIERARALYDLAAERGVKLTAGKVREVAAVTVSESQVRRWLASFREAPQSSVEAELSELLDREDESRGVTA
jgi:hypothetical protein